MAEQEEVTPKRYVKWALLQANMGLTRKEASRLADVVIGAIYIAYEIVPKERPYG